MPVMPDNSFEGIVLAFDFGLKYIGVAAGVSITGTARGVATLEARNGKPHWPSVLAVVREHNATQLVVGLPLNMDDSESVITDGARTFARKLHEQTKLPMHLHDERLTTHAALEMLAEAEGLEMGRTDHELAAALIAESWMRDGRRERLNTD
jgi:putative Holliday junction resolvase